MSGFRGRCHSRGTADGAGRRRDAANVEGGTLSMPGQPPSMAALGRVSPAYLLSMRSRSLLSRSMYSRSEPGAFLRGLALPGAFWDAVFGPGPGLATGDGGAASMAILATLIAKWSWQLSPVAHCGVPNRLDRPLTASLLSSALRSTTTRSPSRPNAAVEKSRGLSESIEMTRHWSGGSLTGRLAAFWCVTVRLPLALIEVPPSLPSPISR